MKKVMMLLCVSLFTASFATTEETQTEEFEVHLEQPFPPITININVSNISDARSNNQVNVLQKQELIQEAKHEEQSTHSKSSFDLTHLLLAYLVTEDEPENPWGATW